MALRLQIGELNDKKEELLKELEVSAQRNQGLRSTVGRLEERITRLENIECSPFQRGGTAERKFSANTEQVGAAVALRLFSALQN